MCGATIALTRGRHAESACTQAPRESEVLVNRVVFSFSELQGPSATLRVLPVDPGLKVLHIHTQLPVESARLPGVVSVGKW